MLTGGTLGLYCLEFPSFLSALSPLTLRIPATELILHRVAYSVLALSLGLACPCDCWIRSIHNLQGFTRFVKESMSPAWHWVSTIPPPGSVPIPGDTLPLLGRPSVHMDSSYLPLNRASCSVCSCLISSPGGSQPSLNAVTLMKFLMLW